MTTTTTMTKPTTTTAPSGFDTEALLSQASLLTYALQGFIDDLEAGSEIDTQAVHSIFEVALKVAQSARKLHGARCRA